MEMRERIDAHKFSSDMPTLFVILTAGKGEHGWTPNAEDTQCEVNRVECKLRLGVFPD